jgi:hypothetical protein
VGTRCPSCASASTATSRRRNRPHAERHAREGRDRDAVRRERCLRRQIDEQAAFVGEPSDAAGGRCPPEIPDDAELEHAEEIEEHHARDQDPA